MNQFYAYVNRLKLIRRWGLMHNTVPENDMEHTMQTALIAHGLAVLGQVRYGRQVEPEQVLALAMYHDAGEVITGDLPTPVKYKNPGIHEAYRALEASATQQLLDMLPADMRASYRPYLIPDEDSFAWQLVKAADRISAYLKCMEEQKMGNREFDQARKSALENLRENPLPEVHAFMEEFVPSFSLTPDELSKL